jgi:hypothetical protein
VRAAQTNSPANNEMIGQQLYICHSTMNSPSRWGIDPVTVTTRFASAQNPRSLATQSALQKWPDRLSARRDTILAATYGMARALRLEPAP